MRSIHKRVMLTLATLVSCWMAGCSENPENCYKDIHKQASQYGIPPLIQAVRRGDREVTERLLAENVPVDTTTGKDLTALCVAVLYEELDIARLLLDRGANPNALSKDFLALGVAISEEDLNGFTERFAAGANVDPVTAAAMSPLHFAANRGNNELVKLLLDHGARPDGPTGPFASPVLQAACHRHRETVQLLLSRGADLHGPLFVAIVKGDKEMAGFLLDVAEEFPGDLSSWDALVSSASRVNRPNIARFLLEREPPASWMQSPAETKLAGSSTQTPFPVPALWDAANRGELQRVAGLLAEGAVIDITGPLGWTPLHTAAWRGHWDVVRLLLTKGANAEARDEKGETPLCVAAGNGQFDIARLLIHHSAEIDARDDRGRTALSHAASHGQQDIVQILIHSGASVDARCGEGWTPLMWATARDQEQIVSMLLRAGANANSKADDGINPLSLAIFRGNKEIAKLLLEAGADPALLSDSATTPLFLARYLHRDEMVKLLKEYQQRR